MPLRITPVKNLFSDDPQSAPAGITQDLLSDSDDNDTDVEPTELGEYVRYYLDTLNDVQFKWFTDRENYPKILEAYSRARGPVISIIQARVHKSRIHGPGVPPERWDIYPTINVHLLKEALRDCFQKEFGETSRRRRASDTDTDGKQPDLRARLVEAREITHALARLAMSPVALEEAMTVTQALARALRDQDDPRTRVATQAMATSPSKNTDGKRPVIQEIASTPQTVLAANRQNIATAQASQTVAGSPRPEVSTSSLNTPRERAVSQAGPSSGHILMSEDDRFAGARAATRELMESMYGSRQIPTRGTGWHPLWTEVPRGMESASQSRQYWPLPLPQTSIGGVPRGLRYPGSQEDSSDILPGESMMRH
ncbi:hypothetical protein EJ05DRAFT_495521 [Pseudovirgaria hyperparasitica]|uniref:Uncharacterized protein n=1 Tax=Pseudovirgaria hyperparasitica TaxID=470096 RepID=A0A6A6WKW3_9PEZI|nr:uncharacterized protein EJ05DRAFT_495521 [Pseudovirgaria hyperparasitica]KAF2762649.1 hypothetical protein EJ05DRAFT_495521 [Pseudovirgaria hyperparasitica]